jgi:hypothetical protein
MTSGMAREQATCCIYPVADWKLVSLVAVWAEQCSPPLLVQPPREIIPESFFTMKELYAKAIAKMTSFVGSGSQYLPLHTG